jgi:hypothetical protein
MGDRSATGGSLGRSLRISLFGAVAVIVTAAFVPLLPATLLPRRAVTPIVGTYIATILWLLRNVVGLNWELRGLGARQLGPVLVASKHQSALETLILQYVLADPAIILMPDAGLGHRTGGATMSAILPAPETTPPITMEQVMGKRRLRPIEFRVAA